MRGILFIALMLMAPSVVMAADEIYIRLNPRLHTGRLAITLDDVATVTDPAPGNWRQQPLFELDTLAHPSRVSQTEIEQSLLKRFTWLDGRLAWGGAAAVTIYGLERSYKLEGAVSRAQRWIDENLSVQGGRKVEYKLAGSIGSVTLPVGKVTEQLKIEQVKFSGNRVEFPLFIYVDQQLLAKRHLQFVSVEPAYNHTKSASFIESKDGMVEKIAMERTVNRPVEYTQKQGSVISKGELVKVLMQYGSIQIEAEARAQENANQGDPIKVQRLDNQDIFLAQVVKPGIVMVKE